jgi:hypothetical protein
MIFATVLGLLASPAAAEPAADLKAPPIAFFVAKGEADICGPGCNEWIAADGTIDRDAGKRLRALLDKLGARKLPLYFHSAGARSAPGSRSGSCCARAAWRRAWRAPSRRAAMRGRSGRRPATR